MPIIFVLPLLSYAPGSRLGWSVVRNSQMFSEATPHIAQERQTIALIREHTQASDFVVSDQQMQVFRAGRQTPPELCDTSYARVKSGYLTDHQAIKASERARMVIFWTNRLAQLPTYRQWVRSNFRLLHSFDAPRGGVKEIYLRD